MITIEPFQAWHANCIDKQDCQDDIDVAAAQLAAYESWTCRMDGNIVAVGGVVPIWKGRSMMWSQISKNINPHGMVKLTRIVKRQIKLSTDRLEAFVVDGHDQGHRWIKLLGFTLDTPKPLIGILPNGESAYLYSRAA